MAPAAFCRSGTRRVKHRAIKRAFGRPAQAMIESLSARTLLFGGDLDTSFSSDGMATHTSSSEELIAVGVDSQSDGKVVVAFRAFARVASNAMQVVRFNVNGTLDTTFGTNGVASATFLDESFDPLIAATTSAIAVQPDNKIVVVGTASNVYTGREMGVVARFDVNGTLDPTFSGNGKFVLESFTDSLIRSDNDRINDVKVQTDGKIVLSGTSDLYENDEDVMGVARLNANGTLDTTLDGDGARVVDVGSGGEFGAAVAIAPDGKLVLVGSGREFGSTSNQTRFSIARLNGSNGSFDSTFDSDGRLETTFGSYNYNVATDVVVTGDGKITFSGTVGPASTSNLAAQNAAVVRLNVNGTRDTTFGTSNGQIEVDFGGQGLQNTASSLIVNPVGRVIVGGSMNGQMAIFALNASGQYDNRFATDGTLSTTFANGAGASDITIGYGGKVLAAGGPDTATIRFDDRRDATVAIGTFNPILKEQGPTGSAFLVTREERLPYATRVYIGLKGAAGPGPGPLPNREADVIANGVTWTSLTRGYVDVPANSTFVSITVTPRDDSEVEGDEIATFSILADPAYDAVAPPSTTFYIRDNEGAPYVTTSSFTYLSKPHKVQMTFNHDVEASLAISDFEFTGSVPIPSPSLSYNPLGNIATITFGGEVLPDGKFTVRLPAGRVSNGAGILSTTEASLDFFFLRGDANRDRLVNFNDLLVLAANFNQTGRNWFTGDFNYDGACNFNDLLLLASRFNKSVDDPADASFLTTDATTSLLASTESAPTAPSRRRNRNADVVG